VLDVAWSLFELRMLRAPATDPNVLWTDITSHYLHIVPHPELSWWMLRVQLVDAPGYMVNYGLGAVLTADMRQHIRESLGPFDTGDSRWYSWLQEHLLRYGSEVDTRSSSGKLFRTPRFSATPLDPDPPPGSHAQLGETGLASTPLCSPCPLWLSLVTT
jgi:Zn-dependent carboxypeptidase